MKTLFTSVSLFFLTGMLQAQTITFSELPVPGDTFVLHADLSPSVSLGNAQASPQTWNFASLQNDSVKYACYGHSASLPFASAFPASNLYTYGPSVLYGGPFGGSPYEFGYTMFSTDATGFRILGFRSNYDGYGEKNVFENPNELLMRVPAVYGNTDNNHAVWQVAFNKVSTNIDTLYVSHIQKTLSCDAVGTVILPGPFGTISNVLRVHEYSVIIDSIFISYGGFTVLDSLFKKDTLNNYYFWAEGFRHPVAIAYCSPSGTVEKVEYLYAQDLAGVEQPEKAEVQISVFPNPCTSQSNLNTAGGEEMESFFLYDMTGKLLLQCHPEGTSSLTFSVENLPKGVCLYSVRLQDGRASHGKLIIQ